MQSGTIRYNASTITFDQGTRFVGAQDVAGAVELAAGQFIGSGPDPAGGELSGRFDWISSSGFGSGVESLPGYDYALDRVRLTVVAVPEPETYAMLLAGLVLLGLAVRRRTRLA